MKSLRTFCLMTALSMGLSGQALAEPPQLKLNNGMEIPQLGIGVWELNGQEAYQSVSAAIKIGYRLIDTAQYYRNEAATYQAVVDSGIPRNEFFLISKLDPGNCTSEESIRRALDESLSKMGGQIDLMLIHWPFSNDEMAWRIMEEYVKKGEFRAIGISNYRPDGVRRIKKIATIRPVLNQVEIHPYNSKEQLVREYKQEDLVVQAWSPLGAGRHGLLKDPLLNQLADKYHKSVAQIILRWDIQRGLVTIPRSKNPRHLQENFEIFDFEIEEEDMQKIAAINRNDALWDI